MWQILDRRRRDENILGCITWSIYGFNRNRHRYSAGYELEVNDGYNREVGFSFRLCRG